MRRGAQSSQRRPAAATWLPAGGGGPTVQPGTLSMARAVTAFEVSEMIALRTRKQCCHIPGMETEHIFNTAASMLHSTGKQVKGSLQPNRAIIADS